MIDLKLRLALRVVMLAAFCFFSASIYVLYESDRAGRLKAEGIADLVAKDLVFQQEKIYWATLAQNQFPDMQVIATSLMAPGLCLAYRSKDGEMLQRLCSGIESREMQTPAFFSVLYRCLFKPEAEIARPVTFHNKILGSAVVTLDLQSLIEQSWRETSRLLTVMAVTFMALCVLIYAALARALRPTRVIVSALKRLSDTDLSARLPPFDLAELSAI